MCGNQILNCTEMAVKLQYNVCLLDAKKASHTVWNEGLFYKLALLGSNMHLWQEGNILKWFVAEQRLHNGCLSLCDIIYCGQL